MLLLVPSAMIICRVSHGICLGRGIAADLAAQWLLSPGMHGLGGYVGEGFCEWRRRGLVGAFPSSLRRSSGPAPLGR